MKIIWPVINSIPLVYVNFTVMLMKTFNTLLKASKTRYLPVSLNFALHLL